MSKAISSTLEDTILLYLQSQEPCAEEFYFPNVETKPVSPEDAVKTVLEELLLKVDKRIMCYDRYQNYKIWHNQYPLFDLKQIIPDFCIDEEMMQKLSFKESIMVSEIDTSECKEVTPTAVGSLCLTIQCADGYVSDKRHVPADDELDKEILQILQKAKQYSTKKIIEFKDLDAQLEQRLNEYETFLKNEMKKNVKKFVVNVSSQFDVNGRNAGSNITSWTDRDFHTLEEKRNEWIYEEDGSLTEKTLYVALQRNKYYVHDRSKPENIDDRKYYSLAKTRDFVGEGANWILLRYLAITKYQGTFELSTTYINGDMCRNMYECTGPVTGMINDRETEVCKIYRYVMEQNGIEHQCVSVLATNGYLITEEWDGCGYILNRNPMLAFASDKFDLEKTWMNDMEFLSKYLDYKTQAEMKMKNFMSDHPEVKDIIGDYLTEILLLKPQNILPFTMDYFQSLCSINLGRISISRSDEEGDDEMARFDSMDKVSFSY